MMREPSMLVRERAAEQLEERQSDWAYSKPVVVLDIVRNLGFVIVAIGVLILSRNESPLIPLRLWIVGYALQCVLHIVCVWFEYRRRHPIQNFGSGNLSLNLQDNGRDYVGYTSLQLHQDQGDRTSVAKHLESANTMFSFIWWIIGFYWVSSGGQSLTTDAPQLYWLCIFFLAFDVFFVVFCVALACVIGIAVCCCLPCIIAILYAVADQHQESLMSNGNKAYVSFEYKSGMDNGRTASSSDHESQGSALGDEEEHNPTLLRRTTIGNGLPDSILDWTRDVASDLSNENNSDQVFSRKHWRLVQCQNGLRIFEELLEVDYLPRSCSRAMKAVGVVEATCEEIFELIMSMDGTRFEWDCSFQYGSLVEEVNGHTAILYHRLRLDWFPMLAWPRDLCYVRFWRRNDDGSYVVLFRSREHENCGPQPGFVRAHLESGGFNISPLKSRNGRPRTQVQHLMQIDLKGWGVGYIPSFQQQCLLQMLNSVAGLREWFSQTDERLAVPRIPLMVNMTSDSTSSKKNKKTPEPSVQPPSLDQINNASRNSVMMDEYSDDDEEFQIAESEQEAYSDRLENETKRPASDEEPTDQIDLSLFHGNLRRDDRDNSRDCWRVSDGNNFRVRSKRFCFDKTKIPAGKHLMELVAVDWFKDTKRMDHVARRQGCAVQVATEKGLFSLAINLQVPGSTHYSMVFYFVMKDLVPGSLLQRFVDGDDEFRNSRLKLIPSVPKGSWIVRQSVGSTPCLLGKAVDCNYIRGPNYLEIDVDIGSSTIANGVLGLVCGVITTLVVDIAFLVQAHALDELPERLIGAVRVSHVELSSAIVPTLEHDPSATELN